MTDDHMTIEPGIEVTVVDKAAWDAAASSFKKSRGRDDIDVPASGIFGGSRVQSIRLRTEVSNVPLGSRLHKVTA